MSVVEAAAEEDAAIDGDDAAAMECEDAAAAVDFCCVKSFTTQYEQRKMSGIASSFRHS